MIAERIALVRERIARAAERAGRDPSSITLLAVSKIKPAADIVAAYEAGQRDFGENYVQEFQTKSAELPALPGARFHMIGKLQSNKSKPATELFGRQCLLARRLVERGVRFVQLFDAPENNAWDHHGGIRERLPKRCQAVDRPIAGLLTDLKSRGLLDDTLVLWGGEFGRTPTAEGSDGREHHPFGFSMWMAGGGVRGGMVHGATDEFGWHAVDRIVHIHDLHATILHLMGLDHKRLTYRFGGRDYRLTDVHGEVVREILS